MEEPRAWSDEDEAAYQTAIAGRTDPSGGLTDGQEAVYRQRIESAVATKPKTPLETLGDRYASVRRVLRARADEAPLSTTEYLLGQLVLVSMDTHAEIAGMRDDLQDLNALLHEQIVRRK